MPGQHEGSAEWADKPLPYNSAVAKKKRIVYDRGLGEK